MVEARRTSSEGAGAAEGSPSLEERQAYLDDLVRQRGYVLPYHRIMVEADLDVMRVMQTIPQTVYKQQRLLDTKTKELLIVLATVVLRVQTEIVESHIRLAIDAGASPQEVLEAIELAIPEAGVPTFQYGLMAWAAVTGTNGLEPTVAVSDGAVERADR